MVRRTTHGEVSHHSRPSASPNTASVPTSSAQKYRVACRVATPSGPTSPRASTANDSTTQPASTPPRPAIAHLRVRGSGVPRERSASAAHTAPATAIATIR